MERDRRTILVGITVATVAIAAVVLSSVLATILLAIAASYVMVPIHRWLLKKGLAPYWGAVVATSAVAVLGVLLFVPIGIVLWLRRSELLALLNDFTGEWTVLVAGQELQLSAQQFQELLTPELDDIAVRIATEAGLFAAQFVVFAFVVFALLYYHDRLRPLAYGPLPGPYHDVANAVHVRVREVLFGHYVVAIIGAVVTYVAGIGVFWLLGYSLPLVFALAVAILWLLPFVSPSVLVFGLTLYHLWTGGYVDAVLILLFGTLFLVAIPRLIVAEFRYRLDDPKPLSSTVYFIGFVGGGLTIGVVGIVIGPLILAVLGVLFDLLAVEDIQRSTL